MTDTQSNPASKYINLRAKNLAFFKQYYPGIYDYFCSYEMQSLKLDILPQINDVDIISDGKHVYGGNASAYAKKELATFLAIFDYGTKIKTIAPLKNDTYKHPRTFARAVSSVYQYYYDKPRDFDGYTLPDFFPLLVFMGVGLGKHIDFMCQLRNLRHAIVFENDMDKFAASLYSVDWQNIIMPFLNDPNRSFTFVLVPGKQNENSMYASLWNTLLSYCPIFPLMTLFYNHQGSPVFDRISDRVNADLYSHLFSFGNFDDELNQLNNALHNFRNETPIFEVPKQPVSIPVCIVGSGPSLDQRKDDLKRLQAKGAIVISCGTALSALHSYGITPDFHIELESDYHTYQLQRRLDDHDYMQSICLIGAAQMNPLLPSLFGKTRLFFKHDGPLAHWFSSPENIIPNATPTCTNAALALVNKLGIKEVFLFGLDYGFINTEMHHAKGSVYYKENISINTSWDAAYQVEMEAAGGGTIRSTQFLYTAKRRTENLISTMVHAQLFNCSDGAKLEGTTWVKFGQADFPNCMAHEKELAIQRLLDYKPTTLDQYKVTTISQEVYEALKIFCEKLSKYLNGNNLQTDLDFTNLCSYVRIKLLEEMEQNTGLYYFIRGSIWHFLFAGHSHLFTLKTTEEKIKYLSFWKDKFSGFLCNVQLKVDEVISRNSLIGDDMPYMPIWRSCASDMPDLSLLKWTYTGISIDNDRFYFDDIKWDFEGYGFDGKEYVDLSHLRN